MGERLMPVSIVTRQDHLAYYVEHGVSPVRQDISDLDRHLQRRESLYRSVGLPASFIEGRRVLEVGPGSGHNSLFVASCTPASFDLVEPNPTGIQGIIDLYAEFRLPHTAPNLIRQRLEDFQPEKPYDIAIAEAWIGVPPNELALLAKLSSLVKPGGVLIVTATSPIGMLANTLRRILGDVLIEGTANIQEQTRLLMPAFSAHLSSMAAMSRPHEDWIQDSLLNPGFLTSCLTPEAIFKTVGAQFSVYETYPRMATDWRWYKSLYGEGRCFNEAFLERYFEQCHNLWDFQRLDPARDAGKNSAFERCSMELIALVARAWNAARLPEKKDILDCMSRIRESVNDLGAPFTAPLDEFADIYSKSAFTAQDVAGMKALGPVFGRELVYVSMLRQK